jgi:hypothetical protein
LVQHLRSSNPVATLAGSIDAKNGPFPSRLTR